MVYTRPLVATATARARGTRDAPAHTQAGASAHRPMADSEDEEWTGRVNPLVYAQRLLHLGEHGDWKGFAQWIENDGKKFNGVHVCRSTKLRDDSVNNRFLASTELLAAELGQIRPGVTLMVRVRGSQHKAPAASERYVNPGGACFLKQQGGNQLTKKHMSKELEKYYYAPDKGDHRYLIVDPACDADPKSHSYCVRVRAEVYHCTSTPSSPFVLRTGANDLPLPVRGVRGGAHGGRSRRRPHPRCQQVPGKQLRDWAPAGEEGRAAREEAPGVVPRAPLAAGGAALAGHGRAALAALAGREDRRRARVSGSAAARAAVVPRRAGRRAGPHAGLGVHRTVNNYRPLHSQVV